MIFKLHYALWYGGLVGIIPFMFNYAAEYAGATGSQHGKLYVALYFVAIVLKPLVCSLADKYQAHRFCLILFIQTTLLAYGSLAIYPSVMSITTSLHKDTVWLLYCLAALVGNTSLCIVNSLSDSLTVNYSLKTNTNYGSHRLWGSIGFGVIGSIWGFSSEISFMPKYTAGILMMIIILAINGVLIACWPHKDHFKVINKVPAKICQAKHQLSISTFECIDGIKSKSKMSHMSLLLELCRQYRSIFGYVLIFTFCGIMTGIHRRFFYGYLHSVCLEQERSFSTLVTMTLPVQALCGELIFFVLSGMTIRKLGALSTLMICLVSFAIRYLLYGYLISTIDVYWILLVELLQGPAFGLMYSAMTHQANYYSERIDEILSQSSTSPEDLELKNALHATLQGILGAAFEGLGLGLGALIGGIFYDIAPVLMWRMAGFSSLFVASFVLILVLFRKINGLSYTLK